jgi:hypothetical protein
MFRFCYCIFHGLDNVGWRGDVGISDAQIDDVDTLCESFLLHLVDCGEEIGRKIFDPVRQLDLDHSNSSVNIHNF